jgi:transcriptional regulator with XRE-family HTH domain
MRILPSQIAPSPSFTLRQFWARIFGKAIEENRLARGLSIEDAAQLAGMEISEWAAIEAGVVPQTEAELRSIAGTLEIGYDRMLNLVLLCWDAWEG